METPGAADGIQTGWAVWQPQEEVGQELRTETSGRSCSAPCCSGGLFLAWCGTGGILLSQFPPGMQAELCRAQLYLRSWNWKLWLECWPKSLMCLFSGWSDLISESKWIRGNAGQQRSSATPAIQGLSQFEHFCFKLLEKSTEHKTSPLDPSSTELSKFYMGIWTSRLHTVLEIRKCQNLQQITPDKPQGLHTQVNKHLSATQRCQRKNAGGKGHCSVPEGWKSHVGSISMFPHSYKRRIMSLGHLLLVFTARAQAWFCLWSWLRLQGAVKAQ